MMRCLRITHRFVVMSWLLMMPCYCVLAAQELPPIDTTKKQLNEAIRNGRTHEVQELLKIPGIHVSKSDIDTAHHLLKEQMKQETAYQQIIDILSNEPALRIPAPAKKQKIADFINDLPNPHKKLFAEYVHYALLANHAASKVSEYSVALQNEHEKKELARWTHKKDVLDRDLKSVMDQVAKARFSDGIKRLEAVDILRPGKEEIQKGLIRIIYTSLVTNSIDPTITVGSDTGKGVFSYGWLKVLLEG